MATAEAEARSVSRKYLRGPVRTADVHPHTGFNLAVAIAVTKACGNMWAFWFVLAFQFSWITLATWGFLHRVDPYPFAFLLFLSNVVQLPLMFAIMVGQQVLQGHADAVSEQNHSMLTDVLARLPEKP